MSEGLSRRGLFAGAGGLALAGSLGNGRWVRAAVGNDVLDPSEKLGEPMSLVVTPGLTYLGMSGYAMQSRDDTSAVDDVPVVGAGPLPTDAVVNNDIAIPHGAVLREFYVSGSQSVNVLLRRQLYGQYAHETIVGATTPAGAGLQEIKVAINPAFTHDSSVGTLLFRASLAAGSAISSMAIGFTPPSFGFVPLPSPKRCFDSRPNALPGTKGVLPQGQERVIDTTLGGTGVPLNARAVVGNVTVTGTVGNFGWIDLRPNGTVYANTSTVSFTGPGQTVANAFTASVGAGATLLARCDGVAGVATDFLIDIVGYYI